MNPDEYNALVRSLEASALDDPRRLRLRMGALIGLGYGYVMGTLALVTGGAVALVVLAATAHAGVWAFKLGIPLAIAAWVIARSLWVRTAPPPGRPFALARSPGLQARVEEIRRALKAPRPDQVLVTGDFNASVSQVPRLGIFGWPRTYLSLGLPLMFALDPGQFDAVLAHEFAHLSRSHPKLGLWTYRLSQTWYQLLAHLEAARSWARVLFESFIRWYAPRMRAGGFVMSRRDEYEADEDAARVTSAEAMGRALIAVALRGRQFEDRFWPDIWRRVEVEPNPPEQPFATLPDVMRAPIPQGEFAESLSTALARKALDDETHPSLRDRLVALGFPADGTIPPPPSPQPDAVAWTSAAGHYLGESAYMILAAMEREWHASVAEPWTKRHQEAREERARLADLSARERNGQRLEPRELWEIAAATADLDGEATAIPHLRRAIEAQPDLAPAHFILGRALLAQSDPAGVEHLQRAMALTPEAVEGGVELLRQYHANRGDEGQVLEAQRRRFDHEELMRAALRERDNVRRGDELAPHGLPDEDLEGIRKAVDPEPGLKAVWVGRKVTTHLQEYPMIVVLVEPTSWRLGAWGRDDRKLADAIAGRISLSANAHVVVVVVDRSASWLRRRMRKMTGAEVYRR